MPRLRWFFAVVMVGGPLIATPRSLCATEPSSSERPPRRLPDNLAASPLPREAAPTSSASTSPASSAADARSAPAPVAATVTHREASPLWPFDEPSARPSDASSSPHQPPETNAQRQAAHQGSPSAAEHRSPTQSTPDIAAPSRRPSRVAPARAVRMLPGGSASPAAALPDAAPATLPDVASSAATANHSEPVRLSPRGEPQDPMALRPKGQGRSASSVGLSSLLTMGGSLSLVLGLFFLVAWLLKRPGRKQLARLPRDVLDVLGRSELPGGREQLQLVRLGRKLVLLWVSSSGVESLAEVTDPAEVDHLVGLCQQTQAGSSTAAFHQILEQVGRGDAAQAPLAAGADATTGLGRLFRRSGGPHV